MSDAANTSAGTRPERTAVTTIGEPPPPVKGSNPLISYRGVKKAFGKNVVYDGLDLDVRRGETLCVIGPSGVGKSVMLKLLTGLLEADGGDIWFDGEKVSDFSSDTEYLPLRQRVAMVFQGAALFDSLTVYENIAYPLREQFKLSEDEIASKVAEKLAWVGLPGIEAKKPAELSGGMKKRVGLARSIATDPEVILYDEPTTGLDPVNIQRINNLILSLTDRLKCTSVVVTHEMATVFAVADRIAFVYDKKIAAVGLPDEMKNSKIAMVRGFIASG
ncbi:MAG TPA: ABC transporter ATP-binding protein, partial [Myxococcota bacterium]